jgi:cytochrome c-type biogenesis protein
MGELSILVAFMGGLFSFLSPCVLPLFPSYLSFITGMSIQELQSAADDARRRRWILANSLAFVVGFSMVFVGMGASFSALGQFLFDYRDRIHLAGGLLIIVFGLYRGRAPLDF